MGQNECDLFQHPFTDFIFHGMHYSALFAPFHQEQPLCLYSISPLGVFSLVTFSLHLFAAQGHSSQKAPQHTCLLIG